MFLSVFADTGAVNLEFVIDIVPDSDDPTSCVITRIDGKGIKLPLPASEVIRRMAGRGLVLSVSDAMQDVVPRTVVPGKAVVLDAEGVPQ